MSDDSRTDDGLVERPSRTDDPSRSWQALRGDTDRDPASSASLDELVAMNIAEDIDTVRVGLEGVVMMLRSSIAAEVDPAHTAELMEDYAARLARAAAGIREAQG